MIVTVAFFAPCTNLRTYITSQVSCCDHAFRRIVVLNAGHVAVVSFAVSGNPEYRLLPWNNRLTDADMIRVKLLQQLLMTNRSEQWS